MGNSFIESRRDSMTEYCTIIVHFLYKIEVSSSRPSDRVDPATPVDTASSDPKYRRNRFLAYLASAEAPVSMMDILVEACTYPKVAWAVGPSLASWSEAQE
jgi:hypothetical protein